MSNNISLNQFTQKESLKVALKISILICVTTTVLSLIISVAQIKESISTTNNDMKDNFSYWLQVGDQFQIERTINNLNLNQESSFHQVTTINSKAWGLSPKSKIFKDIYLENKSFYLSQQLELTGSDGLVIGNLSTFKRLPLTSLLYLTLGLLLISACSSVLIKNLFFKFGQKLINPVVRLSKDINDSSDTISLRQIKTSNTDLLEISTLTDTISTMADKIEYQHELDLKKEHILVKEELSLKLAHDIRSPLAALSIILEKGILDSAYKEIALSSLERISSIAQDLLDNDKNKIKLDDLNIHEENIFQLINKIIDEKRILCFSKSINFSLTCNVMNPVSKVDSLEFCRIVSNILNNSIDAIDDAGNINITISAQNNDLFIEIDDNGSGIPEEVLPSLMNKGTSFGKTNGNGLGLFYAKKLIEDLQGSILINSTEGTGTTVTIKLPYISESMTNVDYVLVEDDEFIRKLWGIEAQNSEIRFTSFDSSKQLLDNLEQLSKSTNFYIDSNLGHNDLGEDLAKKLHNLGYDKLFIASGHGPENFKHLPFLKGVTGKEIPWTVNS